MFCSDRGLVGSSTTAVHDSYRWTHHQGDLQLHRCAAAMSGRCCLGVARRVICFRAGGLARPIVARRWLFGVMAGRYKSGMSELLKPKSASFLKNLRRLGLVEGVSTLVLFGIAMPLKYMANMPKAVSVVGSLHGALFVGLVLMLMMATNRVPISRGLAFMGIVAAIIPFGPFVFDRWLVRATAVADGSDSAA